MAEGAASDFGIESRIMSDLFATSPIRCLTFVMALASTSRLSLRSLCPCQRPLKRRRYATAEPGLSLVEKIVNAHAVDLPAGSRRIRAGDFVTIQPRHVMTHDNTGPVISKRALPHFHFLDLEG